MIWGQKLTLYFSLKRSEKMLIAVASGDLFRILWISNQVRTLRKMRSCSHTHTSVFNHYWAHSLNDVYPSHVVLSSGLSVARVSFIIPQAIMAMQTARLIRHLQLIGCCLVITGAVDTGWVDIFLFHQLWWPWSVFLTRDPKIHKIRRVCRRFNLILTWSSRGTSY